MAMYSREELITPDIAREYLKQNLKNRNVRQKKVREYASDIKAGKWAASPQPIAFYENGILADGQHRLLAVIEANTPATFYVTYDVPNDCTIFDRGISRTPADTMKLSNISSPVSTTNGVAIVNFLFSPSGSFKVSDSVMVDFVNEYEDLLITTLSLTNSRHKSNQCRKSPVMAAVFCALYCGMSEDGLKKFIAAVNDGFVDKSEQYAAIVLRNYIIQTYAGATHAERKFLFVVTTNAIRDFANGKPRKRIYPSDAKPAFYDYVRKNALDDFMAGYKE